MTPAKVKQATAEMNMAPAKANKTNTLIKQTLNKQYKKV